MCQEASSHRILDNQFYFYLGAVGLGLCAGIWNAPWLMNGAAVLSDIFISLLKLVSLPIIFLSVVSTASSMESLEEIRFLGLKVMKYTLLTTLLAATLALGIFVVLDPVRVHTFQVESMKVGELSGSYWNHLVQVVPSNFIKPFVESNVMGVLFLAMTLSFAIITLPDVNRKVLHSFFSSLYAAIMKITSFIIRLMPMAVFVFVTLFVRDLREGLEIRSLALYLVAVILANILQGVVVLPLFLKLKGLSPIKLVQAMLPALSVAFFSKSSAAALPMAISCAENRAGVSSKVANFSLPLCTTINMNGCAAFILITVLFVSQVHGMVFTPVEMMAWIFVATIAAVGNAGVPMGCYFLASAFLAAMNMPLHIMGVILPFYTLIDMIETSINVWSDSCVTATVNKEVKELEPARVSA